MSITKHLVDEEMERLERLCERCEKRPKSEECSFCGDMCLCTKCADLDDTCGRCENLLEKDD